MATNRQIDLDLSNIIINNFENSIKGITEKYSTDELKSALERTKNLDVDHNLKDIKINIINHILTNSK